MSQLGERAMPKYAATTEISPDKTRGEIERTLARYGADQFAYGWSGTDAMIGFRMHGRQIRYRLTLPARDAEEIVVTPSGKWERSPAEQKVIYERIIRQRWRALLLVVKAKLEAVDAGIVSFEEEFLGATMLPDGQTVAQWAEPQLEEAYASGQMPPMLPGIGNQRALPAGR